MAIISDKLNKILNAVFGKDVRRALHDGLDAINKETESTTARQDYLDRKYDEQIKNMTLQDPSSAEIVDMRVAANGKTFKKAGDRLNYFDEQLDTNKNELTDKINEVAKTGTTTEVLQNTTETYIQEKLEDGTIASLTIEKDGVTPEKAEFLAFKSTNLADYRNKNIIDRESYSPTLSQFVSKTDYYRSEYIDLEGNKTIYGKWCGDIYFFNDSNTYMGVTSNLSGSVLNSDSVPDGATKIVVSVPYDRKDKCLCSLINSEAVKEEYAIGGLKINKDDVKTNEDYSLIASEGEMIDILRVDGVQNVGVLAQQYITKKNKNSYRIGCLKGTGLSISNIVLKRNYSKWETFGLWIYMKEKWVKKLNDYGFSIRLSDNTSSYTNNYKYIAKNLYSGWNFIRFSKNEATVEGTAPKSIKSIFISCSDISGASDNEVFSVFYIDSVILNYKLKPAIAIMHDGMWGGLKANGFYDFYVRNRIPITVAGCDWDDYNLWNSQYETDGITREELYNEAFRLSDEFGFELGFYGGHRNTPHEIRDGVDIKTMAENISNLKNTLNNKVSYEPISYVCSQGVYNHKIEKCLKMNNIKIARTTGDKYITSKFDDYTTIFVGTMGGSKEITVEQYKNWIDGAIEGGYCCTIFAHNVTDTATRDVDTLPSVWNEVLAYIKEKRDNGELLILTMSEMYRKLL